MGDILENKVLNERISVLSKLIDIIEISYKKVTEGRFSEDANKERREWSKVLNMVSNTYLAGLKDIEIEDIKDRLTALECGEKCNKY